MKKIILILGMIAIFVICAVTLSSCGESRAEIAAREKANKDTLNNRVKTEDISQGIKVITVDSCEYIMFPQTHYYSVRYNAYKYIIHYPVHKANCKNKIHVK